jgi:alanine dehydrogenase
MPGGVPRTSTYALNNVTTPFGMVIADKGWRQALKEEGNLRNGLNICAGTITNKAVASALNYEYVDPASLV